MALVIAVLAWKNTGSLGVTGRENEEAVFPSVPVTSWRAWNFTWRCIKSIWVRVRGRAGTGDTRVKICCTPTRPGRPSSWYLLQTDRSSHIQKPWSSWGTPTTLIAPGLVEDVPAYGHRSWKYVIFKISSNQNHSMNLCFCDPFGQRIGPQIQNFIQILEFSSNP